MVVERGLDLLCAVRVARSYDRSVPRVFCRVRRVQSFGLDDASWSVKATRSRVVDPIELCMCETMRMHPPDQWGHVYEKAILACEQKLHTGVKFVARGVEFWRVYYGVPNQSVIDLRESHDRARKQWDPSAVIAAQSEQIKKIAYRTRVRAIVLGAVNELERSLRNAGCNLDADLVHSAFSLVHRSVDAVLVTSGPRSPLRGALYPTYAVPAELIKGNIEGDIRAANARAESETLSDNTRVLVVQELNDDKDLYALLAHEIAHAITIPVWQTDNNHPPAFVEFEGVVWEALSASLKKGLDGLEAPSPPRSKRPPVSSSRRAGTRRSR